jgi:uncharacterized membrane protein YfcA
VGGGIVLVPLLVFTLHFAQKRAQAASLAAIVVTALAGSVNYLLAGEVAILPAVFIVVGGVAGTHVGAWVLAHISDDAVRVVFAAFTLAVAVRLAWGATPVQGSAAELSVLSAAGFVGAGVAMGAVSALIGVGGGIVLVPLLVMVWGFEPHLAQGTSLLVMAPIAASGALRSAKAGHREWRTGLLIGAGGAVSAPVGAWLALSFPPATLQRVFAALLGAVAFQLALTTVRRLRHRRR